MYDRVLEIGCFASTYDKQLEFERNFHDNNKENIKSYSCHQMNLIDGTHLTFISLSDILENIRKYKFDQIVLYDVLPINIPNNISIYSLLSYDGYFPEDFDVYRIMFYEE